MADSETLYIEVTDDAPLDELDSLVISAKGRYGKFSLPIRQFFLSGIPVDIFPLCCQNLIGKFYVHQQSNSMSIGQWSEPVISAKCTTSRTHRKSPSATKK